MPIQLRSVIGKRAEMHAYGWKIIKSLLNGYHSLKKLDFLHRGIRPSTVYISTDAKEINFVDIATMTKGGPDVIHPIFGDMPYICAALFNKKSRIEADAFTDI